ncbi:hypothetical protein PIB30_095374, partial [Stylosanthes scabra]|nr:hypothetical protein [Stylosanthes scabra]
CFRMLWRGRATSTAQARGCRYLGRYEMGWRGRPIRVMRPRHQRKASSLRKEGVGMPCNGVAARSGLIWAFGFLSILLAFLVLLSFP